jgi:hypothetical protein
MGKVEKLLIKYVALVTIQEGFEFATSLECPIGNMQEMELAEDENKFLREKIFPKVEDWYLGKTKSDDSKD